MINLPKWPAVAIVGKSVTPEQAFNIILRTDYFLTDNSEYAGGNNKQWNAQYRERSGLNRLNDKNNPLQAFRSIEKLRDKLHVLSLHYLDMDWASSCYIGGPNGWCNEQGDIQFFKNVGKWPSIEEIQEELSLIARSFPFLDMTVSIYNGETCEEDIYPVITYQIVNGSVQELGCPIDLREQITLPKEDDIDIFLQRIQQNDDTYEQGLSDGFIEKAIQTVQQAVESIKKEQDLNEQSEEYTD